MYGGQAAAQALLAAASTVPAEHLPHSLHGYFIRSGDPLEPVEYTVDRDRDGRSYTARRVVARQAGEVIFTLAASFHRLEEGPDRQPPSMPSSPPPDAPGAVALPTRTSSDVTFIDPEPRPDGGYPARVWLRANVDVGVDPVLSACVLTYASDMYTGLAGFPEVGNDTILTSLDHALWFHRPFTLDDWLLMDLEPQTAAQGRGMYTGRIFDRSGRLVAGLAQESLFRQSSS